MVVSNQDTIMAMDPTANPDQEMANLMIQIQEMQNQGEAMATQLIPAQQYSFSQEEAGVLNTQRIQPVVEPKLI